MSLKLESHEIEKIIPHRYPFLLIDKIIEGEIGEYAVGIKQISRNEWYFDGHFPGQPILPGVLQLEMMAQVGAVAFMAQEENQDKLAVFAGVKNARFTKPVSPGDSLTIKTEFTGQKLGLGFAKAEIKRDGQKVSQAELTFALIDKNQ